MSPPAVSPPAGAQVRRDRRGLVLALVLNLGLCAVAFARVLASPGQRVLGSERTETWAFVWGHFCMAHSLLDQGHYPYHLDFLDFPVGGTLWLKDPFLTLVGLPLQRLVGIPVTFTLGGMFLFILAGVALYLLAAELGVGRWPAILAGLTFAFCPHMLGEAYNGNQEAMAIGWSPLWLWAMLRLLRVPGVGRSALAAVLLFMLLLNNQYYALAMAGASAPLALVAIVVWRRDGRSLARLGWLAVALVVGGLLFLPVAAVIRASLDASDNLALLDPQVVLQPPNLSDVLHLVRPMAPLSQASPGAPPFQDLVYPGVLLVLLALAAPFLGRRDAWRWCWPLLAVVFLVLALGPALSVDGRVVGAPDAPFYLPWAYLVGGSGLLGRMTLPHRMAVPAGLFFSLGLAWTLDGLAARLGGRARGRGAVWVAGLAALAEILFYPPYDFPLPVLDTPVFSHARLLGALPTPGAVLNLPLYLGSNPRRVYMWHQAIHRRPIDMAIRVGPPPTIAAGVPFLQVVRGLQDRDVAQRWQPPWSDEQVDGVEALREAGYGFVVLHMGFVYNTPSPDASVWLDLLAQAVGEGVAMDDGAIVYPLDGSGALLQAELKALDSSAILGEARAVYRDGDPVHPAESGPRPTELRGGVGP